MFNLLTVGGGVTVPEIKLQASDFNALIGMLSGLANSMLLPGLLVMGIVVAVSFVPKIFKRFAR